MKILSSPMLGLIQSRQMTWLEFFLKILKENPKFWLETKTWKRRKKSKGDWGKIKQFDSKQEAWVGNNRVKLGIVKDKEQVSL